MAQPPRKRGLREPYVFGDTIPAPDVEEKNTETTWALFRELDERHNARFADTAPATRRPDPAAGDPAFAPTAPSPLRPAAAAALRPPPQQRAPGFDDLMVEARRNNRVCPQPDAWQQLYDLLPDKIVAGRNSQPPLPILGPAWKATPAMSKRLCLRDHLEWAAAHQASRPVLEFMRGLPEPQWLHMGE